MAGYFSLVFVKFNIKINDVSLDFYYIFVCFEKLFFCFIFCQLILKLTHFFEFKMSEKKIVKVWADGCFDMMHFGHANALRQVQKTL